MQRMHDTNAITEAREEKLAKHNLFETPNFFADVYVLRPGQAQSIHEHAGEDKCYHVLAGRGRITSGDEVHDAGPGVIVWCPAGAPHGVSNPSEDEDLRLLVFMAPHPKPPGA